MKQAIETVSKLLDSGRKIQNEVHVDTYYSKPWR